MENIGSRIKHLRKSLNMLQVDFGEPAGLSSGSLSAIENGSRTPPFDAFICICEVAYRNGYSLNWLVLGEGSPKEDTNVSFSDMSTDEQEIIQIYRKVGKRGQRIIMGEVSKQDELFDVQAGDETKAAES